MRLNNLTLRFFLLAAVMMVWHIATLDAAPDWYSDDYAAYIPNALSLLHFSPYALPKYILNPLVDSAPGTYPPGFPALLVLPIALFGVNFTAIAVFNLLLLGGFLVVAMRESARQIGPWPAAFLGIIVGLSPFVVALKTQVQSEFAFMLLLWVSFALARDERRGWLAVGMAATILVRLVGGALLPALPIAVWLRERRWKMEPVAVSAIAGLLVVLGMLLVSPQVVGIYVRLVGVNAATQTQTAVPTSSMLSAQALPELIVSNIRNLPGKISLIWSDGAQNATDRPASLVLALRAATALILLAGVAGFIRAWRAGPSLMETFLVIELAGLLVLPAQMTGPRIFLPLSTQLLFYALLAMRGLSAQLPRQIALGAMMLLVAVPAGLNLATTLRLPEENYSATEPRAQEFFAWIKANTSPDDVILCRRTRALVMFTDRFASDYHQTKVDDGFFPWAAGLKAKYLAVSIDQADVAKIAHARHLPRTDAGLNAALDIYENEFFGARRDRFPTVYRSERFRIYRIVQG
jgi:hypothetical protein